MKNEYTHVKQQFEIICNEKSEILILGSFPSVKSREVGFYYMNPNNRFWRILSIIYDENLNIASKSDKIQFFYKNKLALYDVIEECDIICSYDSSIKNVKYLNIEKIMKETNIKKILCNGTKAYELFVNRFVEYKDITFKLPSTSSANARMKENELIDKWREMLL